MSGFERLPVSLRLPGMRGWPLPNKQGTDMTNLNNELNVDELELVVGGNGATFSLFGTTVHIGTDQTGAPYVSVHSSDGTNKVYRGEPT
jgi:hypothetical protein